MYNRAMLFFLSKKERKLLMIDFSSNQTNHWKQNIINIYLKKLEDD